MKAIVIDQFGDSKQLHLSDMPKISPGKGEVQIEIAYSGVNPVDWKICKGYLKNMLPHEFPLIPGWDASGVISAVGPGVDEFNVGDEVWSYCRLPTVHSGTYAEFITVPATSVAPKPKNLSMAQAAAIPLVALTAWQSLFDFANLKPTQSVLVHAGAGGVGSMAIEFAKYIGAVVLTTASEKNHEYCRQMGADQVIDYTKESFVSRVRHLAPAGLDMAFDCVGGETLQQSLQLVRPGGSLASIVDPIEDDLGKDKNVKTGFVFVQPNGAQLQTIGDLIEEGKVQPPRVQELPLEKAAEAHEQSKTGHTVGKMVLKIS